MAQGLILQNRGHRRMDIGRIDDLFRKSERLDNFLYLQFKKLRQAIANKPKKSGKLDPEHPVWGEMFLGRSPNTLPHCPPFAVRRPLALCLF